MLTGQQHSFKIHYQSEKMVSVASGSATMDLTAVLPALMEGIAQEVRVDMGDLKVILVVDETQLDVKPFQTLKEQYHQVEWDYKRLDQLHNPELYVEIRWTQGERPVYLYQVGTYGSCLSALRSRLTCAMEGMFTSKGAVKMGAVKSFQGGNHINKKVPVTVQFAQSPLPIESFLHLQTWHAKYPSSGQAYALEFNVSFAGVPGKAFNVSTLSQHRWNTNTNWSQAIADVDLLKMYDKRKDVEATLQAMGLDHTRLPIACDPGYRHTVPSDEAIAEQAHADHMRALMAGEHPPSFASAQPPPQSQQSSQSSGVPFQSSTACGPTKGPESADCR